MALQSFERCVLNELSDNSVNPSLLSSYFKYSPTPESFYLNKQLDVSPVFKNVTPRKQAKVLQSSQNIRKINRKRKLKRSEDGADGRKRFRQTHLLPQETAGLLELSIPSKDVYHQRDLEVHNRLRSSFRTILDKVRFGRPQLQRQICENGQDCVMNVPRKILYALRQHSRERVMSEAPKENKVQTERSHQAHQKEYRRYNFFEPAGSNVFDDERPLKSSNRKVSYPVRKCITKIPDHRLMPSQNYQPTVSQITYPAKSRVTGQLSSVDLQDQRNRMDFTEQKVTKNLGQPESCFPTSATNWIVENASCKYSIRIPSHRLMPSQDYQPMVSQIAYPTKSSVTGQLSSVYPQDQKNHMDFTEQEMVKNIGQPESCFLTSAENWKLKNGPSRPTLNGSRPRGSRLNGVSHAQLQENLEQYLERWATESTFMEEIKRITEILKKKGFPSGVSSHPIIFKNGTSSRGESQFYDLPPTNSAGADLRSSPETSSRPLSEYAPHY